MVYGDYLVFVDESGDHGLVSIDPDYPVFVLDFCIVRKDHYANFVTPKLQEFKFTHFGHDLVILHEHDIRKKKPPFKFLENRKKNGIFMEDLSRLIDEADFTIIAAVIDKRQHAATYKRPINPYDLALRLCMERTYLFLKGLGQHTRTTHIVVERRGKKEDAALELAFRRNRDDMPSFEIVFADKKTNSVGLQLADLTARPIGRHVVNPQQPNRAWDIIRKKLRRSPTGRYEGWGLKVFP